MVTMILATLTFARVIYVSPNGSDGAAGLQASPMRTIGAALELLKGIPGSKIELLDGSYQLERTAFISSQHAGLTLEAPKGAQATLIGGTEVQGWVKQGDLLVAPVPDSVAAAGARMLMVGSQLRPRSRMPSTGEFKHDTVFDVPWMSTTGGGWKRKPTEVELTEMKAHPSDIGPWMDPESAEVTVYHMWDESCVGVKSVDLQTGEIHFSSPCGHPPGAFGVQKYVIWNTIKGLTKPGQWFLDRRAKKLYYWPMPGESAKTLQAFMPTLSVLVNLDKAPDVTLRNFTLEVANVPLKAEGFGAGEFDGAITGSSCPRLRCEGIHVHAVAGTGVKLWDCTDSVITRCEVLQTGGTGIRSEGDRSVVGDCTVRYDGLQYPSAIGLWVGGKGAVTSHNEVTDTSYSAIIGAGEGHLISDNYIARAMLTMHDGGGIYFGFIGHATLRHNLVEDIVDTGGYGASAYYLDEQAHDCVVVGNVSVGVVRPSQNHMAHQNTIDGNLFLNHGDLRMDFARCKDYTVQNNVLDCDGSITLRLAPDGASTLAANVFGAAKGTTRISLAQYAEIGKQPLSQAGNSMSRPKIRLIRRRVWEATPADGQPRIWDMSHVGPR